MICRVLTTFESKEFDVNINTWSQQGVLASTLLKPKVKNRTPYGLVLTFFVTKVVTPLKGLVHPEI